MLVPDRLKKARASIGKSQKDMAIALGINQRTYENYEKGVNSPSWDACEAFVKLGFNANWLLTGEGAMKRGEAGEQGAVAAKEVVATGTADRSRIKQAAVGYIDDMTDNEAAEIVKIIIDRRNDPLLRVTGKDKIELIKVMQEQIRIAKEDESPSSEIDLKSTGT